MSKTVAMMLERDVDITLEASHGFNAFSTACQLSQVAIMQKLMELGGSRVVAGAAGVRSLNEVAREGFMKGLDIVLDAGVDINV